MIKYQLTNIVLHYFYNRKSYPSIKLVQWQDWPQACRGNSPWLNQAIYNWQFQQPSQAMPRKGRTGLQLLGSGIEFGSQMELISSSSPFRKGATQEVAAAAIELQGTSGWVKERRTKLGEGTERVAYLIRICSRQERIKYLCLDSMEMQRLWKGEGDKIVQSSFFSSLRGFAGYSLLGRFRQSKGNMTFTWGEVHRCLCEKILLKLVVTLWLAGKM